MALSGLISSVVMLCLAAQGTSSEFITEDLVKYVIKHSNPDVIPQTDVDKPVDVSVSLSLININEVDVNTKNVYLDAWMSLSWNSGLTFDPSKFNNITDVRVPRSAIWVPDLAVYNGELSLPINSISDKAVVFNTGLVYWIPQSKIRVLCDATEGSDVANATCEIKIGSWTYSGNHLALGDTPSFDLNSYFFPGSAFVVTDTSAKKESQLYSCCPDTYEDILFSFTFRKV